MDLFDVCRMGNGMASSGCTRPYVLGAIPSSRVWFTSLVESGLPHALDATHSLPQSRWDIITRSLLDDIHRARGYQIEPPTNFSYISCFSLNESFLFIHAEMYLPCS
jgi:hypothetical protein